MATLNRQDIMDFARSNQDGMLFFMWATDDYAASRCCILNGVIGTGCRLASEAIEKLLKAAICFETKKKPLAKRGDKHDPYFLKEELKQTKDYGLDNYDIQLKKLHDHFLDRYHDNITSGVGSSNTELKEIDEIWFIILELMPIPKEVLYKSYFFANIFETNNSIVIANSKWITVHNLAMAPKLQIFETEYKAIR